jgi:hypothetical protein
VAPRAIICARKFRLLNPEACGASWIAPSANRLGYSKSFVRKVKSPLFFGIWLTFWVRGALRRVLLNPMVRQPSRQLDLSPFSSPDTSTDLVMSDCKTPLLPTIQSLSHPQIGKCYSQGSIPFDLITGIAVGPMRNLIKSLATSGTPALVLTAPAKKT